MSTLPTATESLLPSGSLTQPPGSGVAVLRRQHLRALEDLQHKLLEATAVRFAIWGADGSRLVTECAPADGPDERLPSQPDDQRKGLICRQQL